MTGVLDGRAALVTGASSGIGAATAQAVVAAGDRVALLARRAQALDELSAGLGPAAVPLSCDITSEPALSAAVDAGAEQLGGLDAVVDAVGGFHHGSGSRHRPGGLADIFEVNIVEYAVMSIRR